MINRINLNTQNKQASFGMSKWRDTRFLLIDKHLTEKGCAAARDYFDKEAPKDGKKVIVTFIPVGNPNKLLIHTERSKGAWKDFLWNLLPVKVRDGARFELKTSGLNDENVLDNLKNIPIEAEKQLTKHNM